MSVLDLKTFTDYRAFLLAHISFKKQKNPKWTLGMWSQQLGLKSTSSISKIITGTRHPGEEITEALIGYFKFKEDEGRYFKDLIRLHKINGDARLGALIMEKMGKGFSNKELKILDSDAFQLIANWYSLAIREMTRVNAFVENYDWMAKNFVHDLSPKDCQKTVELLLKLNLLKRGESGKLEVAEGRVRTSEDVSSAAIQKYHYSMCDLAKSSLSNTEVQHREFSGSSMIIRSSNIDKAKELIRCFREKFCRLMEEPTGDQIYQFQIQFFPLTKKIRGEK